MLAADVRREETRSYGQPTHISTGKKVVGADVLLAPCSPVSDQRDDEEVSRDDDDVDELKLFHGRGRWAIWCGPAPARAEATARARPSGRRVGRTIWSLSSLRAM